MNWISCTSIGIAARVNPNVAYLCRGKTRKSASDVAAHRFGQVEAYFTLREVLSEPSTAADDVLSREFSAFCRCRHGNVRVNTVAPLTV
jgi:hypothetical protein